MDEYADFMEPVEFPITEELDLHTFRPQEIADVVKDYLELAEEKGFRRVRIVHGKGIGTQREIVHRLLKKHPKIGQFYLADGASGGWGATWAEFV